MKYLLPTLLLFVLILSSCSKLEDAGYDVGKKLGSQLLDEPIQDDGMYTFCVEKAQKLINSSVVLLQIGDEWYLKEYEFTDGQKLSPSIRYQLGQAQGENINYRYPSNILESNVLKYIHQEIADDGTIQGNFWFKVYLVLNIDQESEYIQNNTIYGKQIRTQKYVVVEQEITDCGLP